MQKSNEFDIKKYAELSMLTLENNEEEEMNKSMLALLAVADKVLLFDTETQGTKKYCLHAEELRVDTVRPSYPPEEILANAKEINGEYISLSAKTVNMAKKERNGSDKADD